MPLPKNQQSASNGASREKCHDESEEEGQNESPESTKTSERSGSSSDESESDESVMDEEECERRRSRILEEMAATEKQFFLIREKLYEERMKQVEEKLAEVKTGTAKEYLEPLEELQDNMGVRIEVAGVLWQVRLAAASMRHEEEAKAAKCCHEAEKIDLYNHMKQDLEDRIRKLEEDRFSAEFSDFGELRTVQGKHKNSGGTAGRREGSSDPEMTNRQKGKRKKPTPVSGPYIVYMLRDEDKYDLTRQ
ncbi:unnamed protein product [Darwinula stevensoni]|uniref:Breast cancer metastasis-suppressor 1-like protein n=1 Tax=Darwinula stevensoni TaxID=69355 RepID=A0A7R8X6A6_9CRUS|nr:unnamed protein product [Darwinula stevensoni]CAG0881268.1 unnamed protein product [Darwinula stevensoni]